jgi:hypothetical protein
MEKVFLRTRALRNFALRNCALRMPIFTFHLLSNLVV